MNPLVAGGVALALVAVGGSALSISQALLRSERTSVADLDGDVTQVVVEVDSGDVRVVAAERAGALVERRERWSLERPAVTEQVVDGVLRVRAECTSLLSWCDVSYVLRVPAGVPVLARTGSGSLELQGTGDVRVDTGSGDVALSAVAGSVEVRSGSGEVTADAVRGPSVVARTGSGDITLTRAEVARVSGRTGSGDVDLELRDVPDEVRARTGSGDVDVELPAGEQAYAVTVRTGSGEQVVDVRTDPSSDRLVDVRTGSGDAVVRSADGAP